MIADVAYMAVPLTATMLRRSSEVGDAALIRGFTMQSKDPTEFHEVRRSDRGLDHHGGLCGSGRCRACPEVNFTELLLGAV